MHSDKLCNLRIVIVNYRTANLTINCLRALSTQISVCNSVQVVVVDNNSNDDSVALLNAAIAREHWSSWAALLPLDRNGGFAFGNNASIRATMAAAETVDYIMLLNPDTVAQPGAIKALLDFMNTHPNVGIAGGQLENADGSTEESSHAFPSPLGELEAAARLGLLSRFLKKNPPQPTNLTHSCDWVSGASMIIRRQVIEDIGLMDEGYFLYFEEVDYCRRAHLAGWECWYVPDSRVLHLEGASTGIHASAKRRAGYWYDSRRRFFIKHYGITGLVVADLLWAAGRLSYLLRRKLRLGATSNQHNDPKWLMFDLLWGDMKSIFTGAAWRISQAGRQT